MNLTLSNIINAVALVAKIALIHERAIELIIRQYDNKRSNTVIDNAQE